MQAWVGGSGSEVTYRIQSDQSRKRQRRPRRGALRDDRARPSSRPGPGSGTAMRPSLTLPAPMIATGRRTGCQGSDPGRIRSGRFRPWDRFPTCLSGEPKRGRSSRNRDGSRSYPQRTELAMKSVRYGIEKVHSLGYLSSPPFPSRAPRVSERLLLTSDSTLTYSYSQARLLLTLLTYSRVAE